MQLSNDGGCADWCWAAFNSSGALMGSIAAPARPGGETSGARASAVFDGVQRGLRFVQEYATGDGPFRSA